MNDKIDESVLYMERLKRDKNETKQEKKKE